MPHAAANVIAGLTDGLAAIARRLPGVRGRGRIAAELGRRIGHRVDGSFRIRMARGHVVEVPRSSVMGWIPAFTGLYDEREIELTARLARPGTFALDIGACFGFWAVPMGFLARKNGGHVIAFEAVPDNASILARNVLENELSDVVSAVSMALGSSSGRVRMGVEAGGTGNAVIVSDVIAEGARLVKDVRMERLDDLDFRRWTPLERCGLVKIDVEGFEPDVLHGGERFVAHHRPVIYAEFNGHHLRGRGLDPNSPQLWAESHGYQCFELKYERQGRFSDDMQLRLLRLDSSSHRGVGDLLLLPEDDLQRLGAIEPSLPS